MSETLIDRFRKLHVDRRREAAVRYRELLLRADAPRAGDEDALAQVAAVLGRRPGDVPGDLSLMQRLAACERAAAHVDELREELQMRRAAEKEVAAAGEAARTKLEQETRAHEGTFMKARSATHTALAKAEAAASDARLLDEQWEAIIAGVSLEEVRASRRAALAETTPPAIHGATFPAV
jgi:hypothetical protein